MMVIAMIVFLVALNHFRIQYQNGIAQQYQYKIEALRDKLAWAAIEGETEKESEAYRFLDYMLVSVGERLPKMNLWTQFAEVLITRRSPREEDFRASIEMRIYGDEACREIYQAANKLWLESVQARHKYSLFVAAASLLPIIGLAQLYHHYCQMDKRRRPEPPMWTMVGA